MTLLSNASHFRRLTTGLALLGAPIAFLAGTLIHPGLRDSAAAQLELIERHPDAWYVTHLLGVVFVVLLIPGVFGLMHLLRTRETALGHLGGGLALVGLVGWGAVVAIFGFVFWQMGVAGDRGEMAALLERVTETPGSVIPTRGLAFAAALGMVCLAIGLFRAGTVPRWACPVFATGFVQFGIGANNALMPLMIVGTVFMTVGLGAIGIMILRQSDAEWEAGPQLQRYVKVRAASEQVAPR
jgi:hypothetical protein